MRRVEIPQNALVVLIGPAGSGKSTFAHQHFRRTEIVSSDVCREMVSDSMEDQSCSSLAFELFHAWIEKRLMLGRLTVADSTALGRERRSTLRRLAQMHNVPVVAIAIASPLELCLQQNSERTRHVPPHVIERHHAQMKEVLSGLEAEGFDAVHVVTPRYEDIEVVLVRDGVNYGPGFDVVGDIHGCYNELIELVCGQLGYVLSGGAEPTLSHPDGRKLVFVGDFTDRGPENVKVLRFIEIALRSGHFAVMGNHDNKLWRHLKGNPVKLTHGLAETAAQLEAEATSEEREAFREMLGSLPHHLIFTSHGHPEMIVCHAGMPKTMVGRDDKQVHAHCLYGEVEGKMANGLPVRGERYMETWPAGEGRPLLVQGHVPTRSPRKSEDLNVLRIDQGCAFGGKLTAFRYPEFEFVHVTAKQTYVELDEANWAA